MVSSAVGGCIIGNHEERGWWLLGNHEERGGDGMVYITPRCSCAGMEALVVAPVSKASAKQRAGRAGRMKPGVFNVSVYICVLKISI